MRYASAKIVKKRTHVKLNNFSRISCRLWHNVEKYDRARRATDYNMTRRMRFACWMIKATDTHSEDVVLIAFPRQQWLHERASILRLYAGKLACLVFRNFVEWLNIVLFVNCTRPPSTLFPANPQPWDSIYWSAFCFLIVRKHQSVSPLSLPASYSMI